MRIKMGHTPIIIVIVALLRGPMCNWLVIAEVEVKYLFN